jgi:single-strand DNA-binding protein
MLDKFTVRGVVGTPPRNVTTSEGVAITSFRLASSQSYWDRTQKTWVETETNWYTVTAFRQLASNAAVSLVKGDRVVVTGALKLREWQSGERTGLTVEVEAESIGLDLAWGTGTFTRTKQLTSPSTPGSSVPNDRALVEGVAVPSHADGSSGEPTHHETREVEPVGASWASGADDPAPF